MFPSPPPLLPFSLSAGCEVGLVLGALSGSGQTEHRAHVALTLDKLLEALGGQQQPGSHTVEGMSQIFIVVIQILFISNNVVNHCCFTGIFVLPFNKSFIRLIYHIF